MRVGGCEHEDDEAGLGESYEMNIAKSIERSLGALAMDRVSRTSSRNSTSLPYSHLRTHGWGRKH